MGMYARATLPSLTNKTVTPWRNARDTQQLRCTVLCVERVLGVTRPPWTLGDDPVGEEEHQRRLGLYREAIRQREEREWRWVEASYYDPLFPAAAAASPPAAAVVAGGDHQPLPQAWDKEFLQFFV